MNKIFKEIKTEQRRQVYKWGIQNHQPGYWLIILMEEVGEAAHALCGKNINLIDYRKEMIQVAAVTISALESFDRNE